MRLKKDVALRKKLEAESSKQQASKQSWTSWLWGSSSNTATDDPTFGGPMTEEQRKQLYDVLDYDEKAAVLESLQAPRDSLKARINAQLKKGSFTLKNARQLEDIICIEFSAFEANFLQRPDSFEASASLAGFSIVDGTSKDSIHRQIAQVKDLGGQASTDADPFFFVKFDHRPLDEHADNALTLRMRHLEIVYHRGYVEAIYKFFKPPESQLESIEALLAS